MAQRVDEAVRGQQPDRQLQNLGTHLALRFERQSRGLRSGRTQSQRGPAVARVPDLRHRGAAPGIELVPAGLRCVHHVGGIGEDIGVDAHGARNAPQLAHVARLYPARNNVHLVAPAPGRFGEIGDEALHHIGETGYVRPDIARRVGVNQVLAGRDLAFLPRLGDDLHDVVANGLRQAGSVNGDDVGLYSANMLEMACSRLAWPPNTAAPSVNELLPAITGSL